MRAISNFGFVFRYESHYATPLGRKKGAKLSEEETALMNKKRSNKTALKYKERQKTAAVSCRDLIRYMPGGTCSRN